MSVASAEPSQGAQSLSKVRLDKALPYCCARSPAVELTGLSSRTTHCESDESPNVHALLELGTDAVDEFLDSSAPVFDAGLLEQRHAVASGRAALVALTRVRFIAATWRAI